MNIGILMEGVSDRSFLPHVRDFLKGKLADRMPKIRSYPYNGRLPKGERLRREVALLLARHDHIVALTDVYTGGASRDFADAADAKRKMREWVGDEPRFHPHAAQYELEAWLLPYWDVIKRLAGSDRSPPGPNPEQVNHDRPPSRRLAEVFLAGKAGKSYRKNIALGQILRGQDLSVAIGACPELKALCNTFLSLSGGDPLP